jgi:integrase
MYRYTDANGKRHSIYAKTLAELRIQERQIARDKNELDQYVTTGASVNFVFDRYISMKTNLKQNTRSNYKYIYDKFIRNSFGKRNINEIKYSDVKQFYVSLLNDGLQVNTLDNIHTVLHPTFQLAVRDNVIRSNPSDGVMAELKKNSGKNKGVRHALTLEQQRAFLDYTANSPVYCHWLPVFTFLFGTGCRIGEAVGIRWEDVDFEKKEISVNHALEYMLDEDRKAGWHVSTPKTAAGVRMIPLLKEVEEALLEEQ